MSVFPACVAKCSERFCCLFLYMLLFSRRLFNVLFLVCLHMSQVYGWFSAAIIPMCLNGFRTLLKALLVTFSERSPIAFFERFQDF